MALHHTIVLVHSYRKVSILGLIHGRRIVNCDTGHSSAQEPQHTTIIRPIDPTLNVNHHMRLNLHAACAHYFGDRIERTPKPDRRAVRDRDAFPLPGGLTSDRLRLPGPYIPVLRVGQRLGAGA